MTSPDRRPPYGNFGHHALYETPCAASSPASPSLQRQRALREGTLELEEFALDGEAAPEAHQGSGCADHAVAGHHDRKWILVARDALGWPMRRARSP